jgi:hypothetical protein
MQTRTTTKLWKCGDCGIRAALPPPSVDLSAIRLRVRFVGGSGVHFGPAFRPVSPRSPGRCAAREVYRIRRAAPAARAVERGTPPTVLVPCAGPCVYIYFPLAALFFCATEMKRKPGGTPHFSRTMNHDPRCLHAPAYQLTPFPESRLFRYLREHCAIHRCLWTILRSSRC